MSNRRGRAAEELFPSLKGQGMISVDCETRDETLKTHGPGWHRSRNETFVAGVAVGTEAGFRRYYPVAHENDPDNLSKDKVFGWLKEQMALPVPKVGAHLLYDMGFLGTEGVELKGLLCDVQVAEPLLDENRFNYSLESISKDRIGVGKIDDELDAYLIEKFGKKNPKSNIWRAPSAIVAPYAIGDVNHPLEIFKVQKPLLEKEGLWDLFVMESKLIPMLYAMRKRGVAIDVARTEEMLDRLKKEQAKLQKNLGDVSVWAAGDLAPIFDRYGIAYPLTPKTRKPSITKEFLDNLDHPVGKTILEIRRLDKMCGTFLESSILNSVFRGRIHCQFNQLKGEGGGAVSGRFSSSNPNLQFIPVRTDEGKLLRTMFIADDGQEWYKFDYSQIEYRLIVHDAADLKIRGAAEVVERYRTDPNVDFHQIVADLTGLSRSAAKTINFGLAYGEGEEKLSLQLGLTRAEAKKTLDGYHARAPFIRPLSRKAMNLAAGRGVVETLLGRKRRFDRWEISKWNKEKKEYESTYLPHRIPGARRAFTHAALNARVQGSAADIMKKAMVDTWESGVFDVLGVPALTVHDELDGSYTPNRKGKEALKEMKRIMESTVDLLVPLRVDGGTGPNWGSIE